MTGIVDLESVESGRDALEQNVKKLEESLAYWRQWEIEYESMREELETIRSSESARDISSLLEETQDKTDENLLDHEERRRIVYEKNGESRSPEKVDALLGRRIDYVRTNIVSLEKSISKFKNDRPLASDNQIERNHPDDHLPLMEIHEELDSEGNVISSSITAADENSVQVDKALRRACVKEARSKDNEAHSRKLDDKYNGQTSSPALDSVPLRNVLLPTNDDLVQNDTADKATPKSPAKAGTDSPIHDPRIPASESPEEAELRRQMLEYNMREVGNVVAELDLEGAGNSEDDFEGGDDDLLDQLLNNDSDDEDNEDEYGRTSTRVLSDDYLAEMKKLEAKLQAQGMINIGPRPAGDKLHAHASKDPESQVRVSVEPKTRKTGGSLKKTTKPKGVVRFAPELDIQGVPSDAITQSPRLTGSGTATESTRVDQNPPTQGTKFNTKRKPINAGEVVERSFDPSVQASTPDEFDHGFIQRQVNEQYHRMRNQRISQEGGFGNPADRAQVSLQESGEYGGKKISRFRAARLGMR